MKHRFSVQLSSVTQQCLTFCNRIVCRKKASPSITSSQSMLKFMSIESMMPFSHLILCHPLLLPVILPSIRVFSSESVLRIRWPKHQNFSFIISPTNQYSGLIFFKIDQFDFAVQGTLNLESSPSMYDKTHCNVMK